MLDCLRVCVCVIAHECVSDRQKEDKKETTWFCVSVCKRKEENNTLKPQPLTIPQIKIQSSLDS